MPGEKSGAAKTLQHGAQVLPFSPHLFDLDSLIFQESLIDTTDFGQIETLTISQHISVPSHMLLLFSPSRLFYISLLPVEKIPITLGTVHRLPLPLPQRTMAADVPGFSLLVV